MYGEKKTHWKKVVGKANQFSFLTQEGHRCNKTAGANRCLVSFQYNNLEHLLRASVHHATNSNTAVRNCKDCFILLSSPREILKFPDREVRRVAFWRKYFWPPGLLDWGIPLCPEIWSTFLWRIDVKTFFLFRIRLVFPNILGIPFYE